MTPGRLKIAVVGNGRGWDNWEKVFRDLYDPPCPECNSRNAMVITTDLCEHPVECVCRNCGTWFSTDDR